MSKKSFQQECEAAGHSKSTVRKQEETNVYVQSAFSISFNSLTVVMMLLSSRVGLSTSVSHSRDCLQTCIELCPFGVCGSCEVDNQYYIMLLIIKINRASSKGRKEVRTTGNSSAKHESA